MVCFFRQVKKSDTPIKGENISKYKKQGKSLALTVRKLAKKYTVRNQKREEKLIIVPYLPI